MLVNAYSNIRDDTNSDSAEYPFVCPVPKESGDFHESLARIMWAMNVGTHQDLAERLGVNEAMVSDALRRGTIPALWLVYLQLRWNISPRWVLTGTMPPLYPGMPSSEELQDLMRQIH